MIDFFWGVINYATTQDIIITIIIRIRYSGELECMWRRPAPRK